MSAALPVEASGKNTAACRHAGATFKPSPSSNFEHWRHESAVTDQKTGERKEFLLLLTFTKHFLHFFWIKQLGVCRAFITIHH